VISAILPVKDGERYLAEAIQSILDQSRPPEELIIVDGDSTDRSAEIARSYDGVTLISQTGEGLAQAWNQAIDASSGDLIGFLDSDDLWMAGKQEVQAKALEDQPDLAGVIGRVRNELAPGMDPPPGFRPEMLDRDYMAPMPGTALIRRELFDQVGYFDEDYRLAMDVDWFARVKDAGYVVGNVDHTVLLKRYHPFNLSHSRPRVYERELVKALRDSARRQESAEAE
jgi:glycosyltransferase involved in cell wall biosynthesis